MLSRERGVLEEFLEPLFTEARIVKSLLFALLLLLVFKPALAGLKGWTPLGEGLPPAVIWTIAINPQNRQWMYASTDEGGFRSLDGGQHWERMPDLPQDTVWMIQVYKPNPQWLFATAGLNGIYRSKDGGSTWQKITQGLPEKGFAVYFTPHPQNPNLYYFCLGLQGIYSTPDFGETWQKVDQTGLEGKAVVVLDIHPQNPKIMIAGTVGSGALMSFDGGVTWSPIPFIPDKARVYNVRFRPDTLKVAFLGACRSVGNGLWRTTNAFFSWEKAETGLTEVSVGGILINPINPDIMYVGTAGGVFRSLDGGDNFRLLAQGWPNLSFPKETQVPDWLEWLEFDPRDPHIIYAGTIQGRIVTYTDVIKGDLDGDFRITLRDVVLALKLLKGLLPAKPELIEAGDVFPLASPDRQITLEDVATILRRAIGLIPLRLWPL